MAGGVPVLIPLLGDEDMLGVIYRRLDGLLLAGGVDIDPAHYGQAQHPQLGEVDALRDRVELLLPRWALRDGRPIFGICRGIQVLNVAAGGTLWQDISTQVETTIDHAACQHGTPRSGIVHTVEVIAGSKLASIVGEGELPVNSLHHQAVKDIAPGFVVTACAPDGIIEGLELPGHRFCVGVQWHPEEMTDDVRMRRLFEELVAATRCPI
jgi:putative glutamine amidotransferase